jgi:hypothetical protein
MQKTDKDLKKTISSLKRKIDELEKEKYDLMNENRSINEKLQKKVIEVERNKEKTKQFSESINTLEVEMTKYKEKHRKERRNLEKLIFKSDKIINYFHNAGVQLGKSVGKMLHHLLIHLEFDMKEIPGKIVNNDINKLYEWIRSLEKNEYLKVRKIFRGMSEKLNFYKKLEIPVLQNAYNRIHAFLKQNEQLAERGEFSMLNATGMNSQIMMSRSKSRFMVNESMMSNFKWESAMDSKILEVDKKIDTIPEALCNFHDVLARKNLVNLTPVLLNDFMEKFKAVVETVHDQMNAISIQPKKNQNQSDGDVILIDKVLEKNEPNKLRSEYQFHLDCINEFQEKLKSFETKIKMIDLILEGRNVTEDEKNNLRLSEILARNKELNEEDYELNSKEKSNIELVKMLEENFNEKYKIFVLKKDFMKYIKNLKVDHEKNLSELFDDLNKVEDEYSISQQAIMNLRNALTLNKTELDDLKNKLINSDSEKDEVIKQTEFFEKEIKNIQDEIDNRNEELISLKSKNEKLQSKIEESKKLLENNQNEFLENKLLYFENKEKKEYLEELIIKVGERKESMSKEKEEKQQIFKIKHKELKELLSKMNKEKKEVTELQLKLDIIEGKQITNGLGELKEETINKLEIMLDFIEKGLDNNLSYDYITNMITDLIEHKDSSFDNFIKLTITSQLNLNDKVAKLNSGFKDKSNSILEYSLNLLKKSILESVQLILLYTIKLGQKKVNQEELVDKLNNFTESINSTDKMNTESILLLSKRFSTLKEFF